MNYIIILNSDKRILGNCERMINEKYSSQYDITKCDDSEEAMRAIEAKKTVKIIIHFIHEKDSDNPNLSLFIDRAGIKQIFVIDGFETSLTIPVEGDIEIVGEFNKEKLDRKST